MSARFSLKRNVLAALAQTLLVAVCLFLSYRILVAHVGLEMMGVWSLIMIASSTLRLGDISGGNSLSRFLAMDENSRVAEPAPLISTVLIANLVLNTCLAAVLYLLIGPALPLFIGPTSIVSATELLPWAVALIVLQAIASTIGSALDGLQRADLRAWLYSTAAIASLFFTWILVPTMGTRGFAAAQAAQYAIVILAGWSLLNRHVTDLGILPRQWRWSVLKNILGYTTALNAAGLAALLFEPLAKFSLNYTAGPALVALFELANRLAAQVRGVAVSAAMPLVPAFASFADTEDAALKATLNRSNGMLSLIAAAMTVVVALAAPILSHLVLGRIDIVLLKMTAVLGTAWSINLLAVPFYLLAQGRGILRWNIASHVWLGLCVLLGAVLTTAPFGVSSVVWGIAFGLITGAAIVVFGNARTLGLNKLKYWFAPHALASAGVSVFVGITSLLVAGWLG